MIHIFYLKEISEILLSHNPSDVVKYKILTNFSSYDSNSEVMIDLRRKLNCSKMGTKYKKKMSSIVMVAREDFIVKILG